MKNMHLKSKSAGGKLFKHRIIPKTRKRGKLSKISSATRNQYDNEPDGKVQRDQFPDLCQSLCAFRVVLYYDGVSEPAVRRKEHVQKDQHHDDAGAVHDIVAGEWRVETTSIACVGADAFGAKAEYVPVFSQEADTVGIGPWCMGAIFVDIEEVGFA